MIRILQVVSSLALGGTEAFIMNNYRKLDRKEFSYDFLVFYEDDYPYEKEINELGGNIYYACAPTLLNAYKFLKIFNKIVKENGPYNAVHSHVNIANSWVMYAAKKNNIPIRISHSHDTGLPESNPIKNIYTNFRKKMIKKNATKFVACSKIAGYYLYGEDFFNKNGIILKNGIDVNRFANVDKTKITELRKSLAIKDSTLVFGNITRFEEKKNTMFTLALFKRITEVEPNSVLILGGQDGGLLEKAKKYVEDNKLSKNVFFIGPRNDVEIWLNIIDCYLFPSRYEGLGIAILEAQAAGCYCICSDNISRETDMGLGRMDFISIENVNAVDVQTIISEAKEKRPLDVKKAFLRKGFDIDEAYKTLVKLYIEREKQTC